MSVDCLAFPPKTLDSLEHFSFSTCQETSEEAQERRRQSETGMNFQVELKVCSNGAANIPWLTTTGLHAHFPVSHCHSHTTLFVQNVLGINAQFSSSSLKEH